MSTSRTARVAQSARGCGYRYAIRLRSDPSPDRLAGRTLEPRVKRVTVRPRQGLPVSNSIQVAVARFARCIVREPLSTDT